MHATCMIDAAWDCCPDGDANCCDFVVPAPCTHGEHPGCGSTHTCDTASGLCVRKPEYCTSWGDPQP
eukprot:UN09872